MKKFISLLLFALLLISCSVIVAAGEEKIPFYYDEDEDIIPDMVQVAIFHEYSYETIDREFFGEYLPDDIEIEWIEVIDMPGYGTDAYIAGAFIHLKDATKEDAVRLARSVWESPKVKWVGLNAEIEYDDPEPEEKIPLAEYKDGYNSPDNLLVKLYKNVSEYEITFDDFKNVIPENVEIASFNVEQYGENENTIIRIAIKDAVKDKTVSLAQALWADNRVMGVDYDVNYVPFTSGDADGDGVANMKDLKLIKGFFTGVYSAEDLANGADVDRDGAITVKDLSALKKLIAG